MSSSFTVPKQDFAEVFIQLPLSECAATPELTAIFSEGARKLTFSRDEVLFQKGQPGKSVYLVRSGEVGLTMSVSPLRGIGFRAKAGSLIGLPAAFGNEPYSLTAVARKGAELEEMNREQFCEMIASNSLLTLAVLRILAAETRSVRIAIIEIAKRRTQDALEGYTQGEAHE